MTARAIIVAAARSGAGKTTVTLGLLRAFRRRGLVVRGAKAGPDYIDPAFHAAATGRPSVNLDSWSMPPALLRSLIASAAADAELLVIEAAMGLFDGAGAEAGRRGAAADLARRFAIPVALVLDIAGQGETVGAIACGFRHYDPEVRIAGVIANNVASARHRAIAADALRAQRMPMFGALTRDPALALPSRHLGLVQAGEQDGLDDRLDRLADAVERDLDLDAILDAAATPADPTDSPPWQKVTPPGQRIALAHDAAFSFTYPHLLDAWHAAGAEILPFSPLSDQAPPDGCDLCWLPGGYPELHAGRLAGASTFLAGLRSFARTAAVHGECGGYMLLGETLEDAAGDVHVMAGLLDHRSSFATRRLSLGYRGATLLADCALGAAGDRLRGHEFHYATATPGMDAPLVAMTDGSGAALAPAGGRRGRVSGSFFHLVAPDGG